MALPAGLGLESLPEPVQFEAPLGRHEVTVALEREGCFTRLVRRLVISRRRVGGVERRALGEFVAEVARADNAEVVLVGER